MIPAIKNRVMEKISDMSDKELIVLLEALDRPDRFTEKRIKLRGNIVRATSEGVGVEFTAPQVLQKSGHS